MVLSPLFNAGLLADIIVKDATSRDVLKAVTNPIKQLGATLMLLGFVLYIFALILFLYMKDQFPERECEDMASCFLVTAGYGMRLGGGIGEHMGFERDKGLRVDRFILDLSYFVIVLIVLLNIVFGIIIDTFSELRDRKKEKSTDTTGRCFICGIEKIVFDRESSTAFDQHIKGEHHMWSYLAFIVGITVQVCKSCCPHVVGRV
jgi:hypothetical protein